MYHIENMLKDLVPVYRKINRYTDKNVNKISGNHGLSEAYLITVIFKNSIVIEVVGCLVRIHPLTCLTPYSSIFIRKSQNVQVFVNPYETPKYMRLLSELMNCTFFFPSLTGPEKGSILSHLVLAAHL